MHAMSHFVALGIFMRHGWTKSLFSQYSSAIYMTPFEWTDLLTDWQFTHYGSYIVYAVYM